MLPNRFLPVLFLCLAFVSASAQAIDPQKSAKAAVMNDAVFVANHKQYNKEIVLLSQKAAGRSLDARVKELAQQMVQDHTGMLYSMEQLEAAGTGAAKQNNAALAEGDQRAALLNTRLSRTSGFTFDTMWVANILSIQQGKYDELVAAKETVTNGRLKTAITEAISPIRKQVTQLKSIQKYLIKAKLQRQKEEAAKSKK